jgi:hypothetical protein
VCQLSGDHYRHPARTTMFVALVEKHNYKHDPKGTFFIPNVMKIFQSFQNGHVRERTHGFDDLCA